MQIGLVSDGKYGKRAYENIKIHFDVVWIEVPEFSMSMMLDDDFDLKIPDCEMYISYVRHPDVILSLAELNKPLILGVLPGIGLLHQIKQFNPRVIHAPTMCSLEDNTGIEIIDQFLQYFGRPIYQTEIGVNSVVNNIIVKRSSLCGSSEAGAEFMLKKVIDPENLQNFALYICHECRAPRFGHTCDKEAAGIIHLKCFFESISHNIIHNFEATTKDYIDKIENEYFTRRKASNAILNKLKS